MCGYLDGGEARLEVGLVERLELGAGESRLEVVATREGLDVNLRDGRGGELALGALRRGVPATCRRCAACQS